MIPIKIKIAGVTIDAEISGITLQAITDASINGEGCNVTTNSIIIKEADLQLNKSALLFNNKPDGDGNFQRINPPLFQEGGNADETLSENLNFRLPMDCGGTLKV